MAHDFVCAVLGTLFEFWRGIDTSIQPAQHALISQKMRFARPAEESRLRPAQGRLIPKHLSFLG
jgi:hypothetical protein